MAFHHRAAALVAALLLLAAATVRAQEACAVLAESALAAFSTNCANLEANAACYGYPAVSATFTDDSYAVLFTRPGDRPPLSLLTSLHAQPSDLATSTWGMARLELALPDTADTAALLLLGDAAVENLGTTELPFRTLHFSGGAAACGETPSALAILTPDEATDFTLNGANVRVTSLVVFQWLSANSLAAIVQSGRFEVIGGQTAGREQTLLAVTDNDGRVVYWSAPRTSTAGESRAATIAAAAFAGGGLPVTSPPTPTAEPPPTLPPPACGSSLTHVVQPGETVFRIAQRYGSTVNAIAAANGLANPNQIRVGQTLSIPCGVDSGAPSTGDAAPSAVTPVSGDSTTLDCSALTGSLPPNVPPIMLDMLRQMCGS